MMTTLTSVGYGDLYAISMLEKIILIPLMIGTFVFLNYMIDTFVKIRTYFPSVSDLDGNGINYKT